MVKMIDLEAVLAEWPENVSPDWCKLVSLLPRYIDADLRDTFYAFAPVGLCNRVNRGDFDVDVPDTPPEPQPAPADPPRTTPCCVFRCSVTPEEWRGFMKGAVIACLDHNNFDGAADALAKLQAFDAAHPETEEPEKEAEPVERTPVAWVLRSFDGFIDYNSCVKKPSEAEDRYIHGVHGGWCPVYW